MEEKIGYAVITTNEYKELIKNECRIKELEEEIFEKDKLINSIVEKISINIKERNEYEINDLRLEEDDTLNKDNYGYRELRNEFFKFGISNEEYINQKIKEFYENRKIEQ